MVGLCKMPANASVRCGGYFDFVDEHSRDGTVFRVFQFTSLLKNNSTYSRTERMEHYNAPGDGYLLPS